MKTEDKKIAVIGIGGVGGYVAGMLAKAYPHVTMVARGARGESIRKNGLVLHLSLIHIWISAVTICNRKTIFENGSYSRRNKI